MVQARTGIVQFAGFFGHGGQFAQRLAEFAGEPAQALHHRARAQGGEMIHLATPGDLVTAFQCIQCALQALDQRGTFGIAFHGRVHQAVAARRSNTLPSFSSSVCAVNGLMM